jgi:hypothetical protein
MVNFQSAWKTDGLCTACINVQVAPKANLRGMIWGQMSLENVSKAGNPLTKQSKESELTCGVKYDMF